MTKRKVLIVTSEKDATIEYFLASLSSEDRDDILYYKTDCPNLNTLELSPTTPRFKLYMGNKIYTEKDIRSIYYRRTICPPNKSQRLSHYLEGEHIRFWESMEYCFPEDVIWFPGRPSDINKAKNKLYQLVLARELGLPIPEKTVHSNNPLSLLQTQTQTATYIWKTIKSPNVPLRNTVQAAWTTLVDDDLRANAEGLLQCPGIIQTQVGGDPTYKMDIRVTIIGCKVFAAENKNPCVDGRLTDNLWAPHTLPVSIKKRLLLMVRKLSLNYGAID